MRLFEWLPGALKTRIPPGNAQLQLETLRSAPGIFDADMRRKRLVRLHDSVRRKLVSCGILRRAEMLRGYGV